MIKTICKIVIEGESDDMKCKAVIEDRKVIENQYLVYLKMDNDARKLPQEYHNVLVLRDFLSEVLEAMQKK